MLSTSTRDREDIENDRRVVDIIIWLIETPARIHRVVVVIQGSAGKSEFSGNLAPWMDTIN